MASDDTSVFDPETLGQLRDLIDADDTSFLDDLFQSYLKTASEVLETLRADPSNDTLHRAAHTLKGSSLNVGAIHVASLCKQLEADLKQKRSIDMPERVAKIEIQLQRVVQAYPETVAHLLAQAS
jgi:HPt (histidine-containing phosphotransfer) domain-containing protein